MGAMDTFIMIATGIALFVMGSLLVTIPILEFFSWLGGFMVIIGILFIIAAAIIIFLDIIKKQI